MDTIYALSTVRGRAGLSVLRISGQDAGSALVHLGATVPLPRRAAVRNLVSPGAGRLDQAIVIHFPEGSSFTGEETVELQLHGGIATADAVLRELSALPGFRLAKPGEFSLRALQSGRMNLTEIEGLSDLVNAETEAQRRQARRLLDGELAEKALRWRQSLLRCSALLEAVMEFADEDLPHDSVPEALTLMTELRSGLEGELAGIAAGERIRDGFEVAIIGAPNVGKSTLLNRLAGREAALTSEFAGTTRDIVEVRMDLDGLPVTFLDTAGIRESKDPVERLGVERAVKRAGEADIRIVLVGESMQTGSGTALRDCDIVLQAKADLHPDCRQGAISGKTGEGVQEMLECVTRELSRRAAAAGAASRERHRASLSASIKSLNGAIAEIEGAGRHEIAVEEIRQATRDLEFLLGEVDIEHVLDDLFSSLCIGK